MEQEATRVAVMAILVTDRESVEALNALLHEYGRYILGRMGIPYESKNINIITIAMDAPQDITSAVTGKIGRLPGVTIKAVYSKA
ncbi:MAG: TM1266 family iron-only hydrogenase system putative regulator [Saccharofermentanales bacterium]|jgi:putative iron-only hydrogenase system regulator